MCNSIEIQIKAAMRKVVSKSYFASALASDEMCANEEYRITTGCTESIKEFEF